MRGFHNKIRVFGNEGVKDEISLESFVWPGAERVWATAASLTTSACASTPLSACASFTAPLSATTPRSFRMFSHIINLIYILAKEKNINEMLKGSHGSPKNMNESLYISKDVNQIFPVIPPI